VVRAVENNSMPSGSENRHGVLISDSANITHPRRLSNGANYKLLKFDDESPSAVLLLSGEAPSCFPQGEGDQTIRFHGPSPLKTRTREMRPTKLGGRGSRTGL